MNLRHSHRHGKAWKQIGVDDNGGPMYALGFWDKVLVYGTTLAGVALWIWAIAVWVQG